jgi:polyisoprenoid-binding protein YceI
MRRCSALAACLLVTCVLLAPFAGAEVSFIPVGAFAIVPGDSSVLFMVPDNRGGFAGQTTRVTGRAVIAAQPGGDEYNARVTATIDASSMTTGNGSRDAAMRSTYLKTEQFPSITFQGTVQARPGLAVRPFPAKVQGGLTIRDITRDVEFPATVTALDREFRVDAVATVRMADYQIPYPRAFIFVARDPVTVTLHIRAHRTDIP